MFLHVFGGFLIFLNNLLKNRWREGELIGSGSYGEVIMGFNEDNGQIMAVKQVNLRILQNNADVWEKYLLFFKFSFEKT